MPGLFRHLVAVGELFGKVPETLGSVELVRKYIPGVGIESSPPHYTPFLVCFVFAVEEAVPRSSALAAAAMIPKQPRLSLWEQN